MPGIVAYGAYVPYYRLQRAAIGATLGSGGGKGTRSVASYDEDSTSMGVEAARVALKAAEGIAPQALVFATSTPPYLDKTNATAIHAALGLPTNTGAFDMVGSVRSAIGAQRFANMSPAPILAVMSDVRTGLPGGADERDGGDAAVAFLYSGSMYDGHAIVELVGR
ncbi:MAG TPA: hydroxymethylglutaryl-CoA synthase, partial [Acidimicrobiales bacterium]|nr:hydroxymethylglutaryl-CoA synthase [Acidimicrobiales bacterium]